MPAELVEAAEILVGSGAAGWVVDKLLGPSASALGEQIKVYGTGRFRSVVSVFATKAETRQHDLQALPPGFAYQFFQKASFSEDDEFITECWANLLLSAATEYAPRHSIVVDILSQMSADDAKRLDNLVPPTFSISYPCIIPSNFRTSVRLEIAGRLGLPFENLSRLEAAYRDLVASTTHWPSAVTNVHLPYQGEDGQTKWFGGGPNGNTSDDVLIRQSLVERFGIDLTIDDSAPNIEGILITGLGVEFLAICRGVGAERS